MRTLFSTVTLAAGLLVALGAYAQAPASAPAGTTGLCKDGSYSSSATKKGACASHGGVKDWYGTAEEKPAAAPATPPSSSKTQAPASKTQTATSTKTAAATPAPGGGAGKVWVNTSTKVYHCEGTKWYGTTKKGEYMTEAEAKAAGAHADHGKSCSK